MRSKALLAGLLLAATLITAPAPARESTPTSQAELVRGVIASVVNITARVRRTDPPQPAPPAIRASAPSYKVSISAGSGFVIDPAGLIATNWHVLENAFEIVVTFATARAFPPRSKAPGGWSISPC